MGRVRLRDAEAACRTVRVCACACVFMGMGACLCVLVCVCVSVSLYIDACVWMWEQGPGFSFPGTWSMWLHLQLRNMTEAESPWGAWKARLKGMWSLSVCLSFSPRGENPDLRAIQLSAHYLPSPAGPNQILVPHALHPQRRLSPGVS